MKKKVSNGNGYFGLEGVSHKRILDKKHCYTRLEIEIKKFQTTENHLESRSYELLKSYSKNWSISPVMGFRSLIFLFLCVFVQERERIDQGHESKVLQFGLSFPQQIAGEPEHLCLRHRNQHPIHKHHPTQNLSRKILALKVTRRNFTSFCWTWLKMLKFSLPKQFQYTNPSQEKAQNPNYDAFSIEVEFICLLSHFQMHMQMKVRLSVRKYQKKSMKIQMQLILKAENSWNMQSIAATFHFQGLQESKNNSKE